MCFDNPLLKAVFVNSKKSEKKKHTNITEEYFIVLRWEQIIKQ